MIKKYKKTLVPLRFQVVSFYRCNMKQLPRKEISKLDSLVNASSVKICTRYMAEIIIIQKQDNTKSDRIDP